MLFSLFVLQQQRIYGEREQDRFGDARRNYRQNFRRCDIKTTLRHPKFLPAGVSHEGAMSQQSIRMIQDPNSCFDKVQPFNDAAIDVIYNYIMI